MDDHAANIADPAFPECEVSYTISPTGGGGYSGPDMSHFPSKHGYEFAKGHGIYASENYDLRVSGGTAEGSGTERQRFLIEWLFFGPLADIYAVLDLQFRATDFVDGRGFLHLRHMESYALRWKARELAVDAAAGRQDRKANLYNILELTDSFYQRNVASKRRDSRVFAVAPECALLIRMLHEALRFAWGAIYESEGVAILSGSGIASDLPDQRMRAAGWCPSEIVMLQQRFTVTGREFASRLKRRKTIVAHERCSKTKCFASQVDNDTYVTKHTEAGCHCDHIGADSEAVKTALKAGKTPRFLIISRGDSAVDLEIKTVDSGPYVAISHVWAHGLGNAQENSLPLCQIRRLHEYLVSLKPQLEKECAHGPVALWIDTLGVPLERESRKLALKALQGTYADSAGCLVLDEELYQASGNCSPEEVWLRQALSTWSRRLWTFQEGFVTGEKLFLQFSDGARAVRDLRRLERPSLSSPLFSECTEEAKRNLPRERDVEFSKQRLISSITEACRYRTTSRLSDECFCLASVAGLDVHDIIQASTHEDKMRLFLLQLREVPKTIIFHTGPRLTVENFQWAPLSFLYPEPSSNIFESAEDDDAKALCLPCGLRGQWSGFYLEFPQGVECLQIYWFKFRDFWIVVHPISSMKQELWAAVPDEDQNTKWQQAHLLKHPALLVDSLDILQNVGLLLSVESSSSQAVVADCVLRVNATTIPIDQPDIFNPDEVDPAKGVQISGSLVDEEAVWTIR
ncbi:MAG: hypothetical protein Q9195_001129 [Heterodermia aff. obscurata]